MDTRNSRFKRTEQIMTLILLLCFFLFIIFLSAAAKGIIWLKIITAIITSFICALCLVFLYMTKLIWRPRSIWMTFAAAGLFICLLFSLILGYPSPL